MGSSWLISLAEKSSAHSSVSGYVASRVTVSTEAMTGETLSGETVYPLCLVLKICTVWSVLVISFTVMAIE